MKRLVFAAILVLASLSVVNAQPQQFAPQQQPVKVYSKAIDSINVVGMPFNVLAVRAITLNGISVTVQSSLAYVGTGKSKGTIPFSDTWEITDATNVSYAEVIKQVALLHEVKLK